ncbi:unnamed protein product [Prorocentrum cordatum]|uniref:ISXO2-like transposase domain-containing protein n=1 Tax=Prorocentrum cordatum TaxID=2364126 RepID=A0ABN9QC96_9DINO|nr:unnamed protein product [Polarella glacialis]
MAPPRSRTKAMKTPMNAMKAPAKGRAVKKTIGKKVVPPKTVPYIRHGAAALARGRKDRAAWASCIKDFVNRSEKFVINKLRRESIVPNREGATCPHCGEGVLGPLRDHGEKKGGWGHRCSRDWCTRHVAPQDFHPIFCKGTGQSFSSLAGQSAILFCAVAGCPQTTTRLLARRNHKWPDVEADEVDLGKMEDPDAGPRTATPIIWEQWGGIVQRGAPESLVLFRLQPKKTKRRAPGPGPIRKADWAPLSKKWLKNRNVIFHTDGARSYKLKEQGVVHNWVVHKKKKAKVKGKWVWLKPSYSKKRYHDVPDPLKAGAKKRIWVKTGTQIIDGVWRELRRFVGKNKAVGSAHLMQKVRSFQWAHWNRGKDLWHETGAMLQEAWSKKHGW